MSSDTTHSEAPIRFHLTSKAVVVPRLPLVSPWNASMQNMVPHTQGLGICSR